MGKWTPFGELYAYNSSRPLARGGLLGKNEGLFVSVTLARVRVGATPGTLPGLE